MLPPGTPPFIHSSMSSPSPPDNKGMDLTFCRGSNVFSIMSLAADFPEQTDSNILIHVHVLSMSGP